MRAATLIATAILALAVPAGVALAHHGWSSYDAAQTLSPTTWVVESRWGSPHGALVIAVDGKRWDVVLAPVARMEARGLIREDIAVGRTVTVVGYPRRDGTAEIRAERIIVGDKTVELR